MSVHDPIADMLTILRNAARKAHNECIIKKSKQHLAILEILKQKRFVHDFRALDDNAQGHIKIYLTPPTVAEGKDTRKIKRLMRISRPGLRTYVQYDNIPYVLNGLGYCILSTSRGMMTGQDARRQRIGGEVLLKIW